MSSSLTNSACHGLRHTWLRVSCFTSGLIRLVGRIKINKKLKIQWEQHHYFYVHIVYNVVMALEAAHLKERDKGVH